MLLREHKIKHTVIINKKSNGEKIENLTRNIIQKSAYVFSYQQMNKQTFLSELQQHDIFYCVVHGSTAQTMQISYNPVTRITMNDINSLESDALNNLKLVILACCNLGNGRENGNNMANLLHSKGVETVIAFENIVYGTEIEGWVSLFFANITPNKTVKDTINFLNAFYEDMYNPMGLNPSPCTVSNPYICCNENLIIFN